MDKEDKGFLSSKPGSKSTTRLNSIICIVGGMVIFAAACFVALYKGADIGGNITAGCVSIIGLGIAGKGAGALLESRKK